jgi:hypothetical protein
MASMNFCHAQVITSNSSGFYLDDFYSFSLDTGEAVLTLHGGGRYETLWREDSGEFIAGVGWKPGHQDAINYVGTFAPDKDMNAYLALHGYFADPIIDYHIIETYGSWNPKGNMTYSGTYLSDGAEYDLYYQENPLFGINPQQTYTYMSIRQQPKPHGEISGIITTKSHFDAWADLGLNLGEQHRQMIMATWSYQASGSSDITVTQVPLENTGTAGWLDARAVFLLCGLLLLARRSRRLKGY